VRDSRAQSPHPAAWRLLRNAVPVRADIGTPSSLRPRDPVTSNSAAGPGGSHHHRRRPRGFI